MKLAIVGSRNVTDYNLIKSNVDELRKVSLIGGFRGVVPCGKEDVTEIISGGARGVDSLAARYAGEHDLKLTVYPADWDKYDSNGVRYTDRGAGYARNHIIAKNCDVMIAFWDGTSVGTKHSIKIAKMDYNKPVHIVLIKEDSSGKTN